MASNVTEGDVTLQSKMVAQREKLQEIIESNFELIPKLVSSEALTHSEREEIEAETTTGRKNKALLDIFEKRKQQEFIAALRDSDQIHIVNWIEGNGVYKKEFDLDWPLTEKEAAILQHNFYQLCTLLDTDHGFLTALCSKSVISIIQMNFIQPINTRFDRVKAFLDILRRSSLRKYFLTVECLQQSNQNHIAKILKNGGVIVPVHSTQQGQNTEAAEVEIVQEVTRFLCERNVSLEDTDLSRLLARLRLSLTAVRQRDSIVLYICCYEMEEFSRLLTIVAKYEMKEILDLIFKLLLKNNQATVLYVEITKDDEDNARRWFECEKLRDKKLDEHFRRLRSQLQYEVEPMELTVTEEKVTDDKVKLLGESSSSKPSSPSQPLSPKARATRAVIAGAEVAAIAAGAVTAAAGIGAGVVAGAVAGVVVAAVSYSESSSGRRNATPTKDATPEAKPPSPKRGFFGGFFQSNPALLKPFQEAISTHLVKSLVIENHNVYGVAHLDMRYYVLCRSPNVLLQYSDQSPFTKIKDIDISKYVKLPQDLAACNVSKCLYVTDIENCCVWKVELGYPPKVTKWVSDVSAPHTVSVNARNGQVTTFGSQSKGLRVYAASGELAHTISLPGEAIFPQHAVETSKGNFIVSYGELKGKKQGVCEVSLKGKVMCRYEHELEELNHPTHLAIDADDKVFVADNANNRVLQLDARLKFEQSLPSEEKDRLEEPFRLCYTSKPLQKRLLVEHRFNTVDIFNVS